jgi:hypothetical protein
MSILGACAIARARLVSQMTRLDAGAVGMVRDVTRTAAISGTNTIIKDAVSKGIEFATQQLVHNLTVPLDVAQSVVRGYFTKTDPALYRTIASTVDAGGRAALRKGFAEGWAETSQVWQNSGLDPAAVEQGFPNATYKNPTVNFLMTGARQAIGASARAWYNMTVEASNYSQAKIQAGKEGFATPEALAKQVDYYMNNPTLEMMLESARLGHMTTFSNQTSLGDLATSVRNAMQGKSEKGPVAVVRNAAANTLLPVTRVPGSVFTRGIVDNTPLGAVLRPLMDNLPDAFGGEKNTAPARGALQAVVRGAGIGSGMLLMGYKYAEHNAATGTRPTSRGDANVEEATGGGGFGGSVRIGGEWLLTRTVMGTWAIPFELGATYYRLTHDPKYKDSVLAAAGAGTTAVGQMYTEDSFLENLSRVAEAVKTGSGSNVAASLVPVPQIVGQASNAMDSNKRVTEGVGQRIMARAVPGYSRTLPEKHDVLGREILKDQGGVLGSVQQFLDPTKAKEDHSTPATDELERLGVGIASLGGHTKNLDPTKPDLPISQAMRDGLRAEWGPKMDAQLTQVVQSPMYQKLPDAQKRIYLSMVINQFQSIEHLGAKMKVMQPTLR